MIIVHTEFVDRGARIDPSTVDKLVTLVLSNTGVEDGRVTVIFGTNELLRDLKRRFFDEDVYSDVIAFRLDEEEEQFEGEIYIAVNRAEENAKLFSVSVQNELSRLIVHGILHLLGHNDDTSEGQAQMRLLEDQFLQRFTLENSTRA